MATSQTTRKKGLADMLPALSAPVEAPSMPAPEKPAAPKQPEVSPTKPSKPAAPTTPAYLALQRKETRLREEQIDALTAAARELNRAKPAGGERITENTLIRVAVDLLLSNTTALTGSNEGEIRNSVGL
ncbi:hypothetical protein ACX80E_15380 [Arthrobacter sp. TMN-49]